MSLATDFTERIDLYRESVKAIEDAHEEDPDRVGFFLRLLIQENVMIQMFLVNIRATVIVSRVESGCVETNYFHLSDADSYLKMRRDANRTAECVSLVFSDLSILQTTGDGLDKLMILVRNVEEEVAE